MLPLPDLDPSTTAVLAIDMHRGHLDPDVATMPVTPELATRVISATEQLFDFARSRSIPIVHTILESRLIPGIGRESLINPFRQAMIASSEAQPAHFKGVKEHNVTGSVTTESMPTLRADYEIRSKRRLGSFYGTDLEPLLRALRTETLILAGINTNTCVQNAAFEAFNRDFRVIMVEDCVGSMYGEDLHQFALENVRRCLGWVVSLSDLPAMVRDQSGNEIRCP